MVSSERPPGSPEGILALAAVWRTAAASAEEAATTLDSAKNDMASGALKLQGDFVGMINEAISPVPGELRKLSTGYTTCAQAIEKYAETLRTTQATWDREADDAEIATRDERNAALDLDTLAPGWTADIDPSQDTDRYLNSQLNGQPDLRPQMADAWRRYKTAQETAARKNDLAAQARAMRDEAERTCANEIDAALDKADIRNGNAFQRLGNWVKDHAPSWDDFVKFCENASAVLGVVAMFAGPLAPVLGALAAAATAVVLIDKAMKLANGELTLKDMAGELVMVALNKVGGKALKGAYKAFKKTDLSKTLSAAAHRGADKVMPKSFNDAARNTVHRKVCKVTGHPVDIATGKVFTSFTDLELPGPLPLVLERVWFSTSKYVGPFGYGWHHTYDAAMLLTGSELVYRTPDGRFVDLIYLMPGESVYDRQERLTITRDESGFRVADADGLTRRFAPGTTPVDDPRVYLLQEVTSRAGHRHTCAYDDRDRLVEIVDSGGRDIGLTYDDQGRVASVTAPHPDEAGQRFTVSAFAYDEAGNLATATDARGYAFTYVYQGHLLSRETDRTGLTFHFRYDGVDETARCISTWGDGDLYRRELTYAPNSTIVVDSLGHPTVNYHEGGLVVRAIDALGGERRTEYDYAQPVEETDPLGRVTRYEYDWRGNLVEVTTPDGASVTVEFDEADQPVRSVDQVGGEWAWEYDDHGLLTVRRDPLGRETRLAYARGLLETITDPAGGRTVMRYDAQGSLVEVVTPDGESSRWERNALGWPVAAIDPLGNAVRRTFDLGGNITRVDEPDGNVRTLGYDGESNLTSAEDALYDVKFAYQGMGRLASRTQAGTTVRFEYDTEEQLVGIVNEHGYVYSFTYGPTGLVSTERGFDGIMRLYERDMAGRMVSVRRASGMITRHEYDDLDRVVRVAHSDGTSQRYAYRADGALMAAANDTIEVLFERDVQGRLLREVQGKRWVASTYDDLDRRIRITSSMGADQTITRNAIGDVMAVSGNGYSATITRDAMGQEITRSLPGGLEARWHWDRSGRLARQEVVGAGGTSRERTYDWDFGGELRGILDSLAGPVTYNHDGLGQLVSATYSDGTAALRMPDAVGNLFLTEDRSDREYGAAGQVLSLIDEKGRQVQYDYDPEGNLVSKVADDGETWRYHWYADGNMSAVERPDGTFVTFGYDALSRRVTKSYRGRTTYWVWDGDVILHEWLGDHRQAGPSFGLPGKITAARDGLRDDVPRRAPPDRGTEASPLTWLFDPGTFFPMARIQGSEVLIFMVDQVGAPYALIDSKGADLLGASASEHGGNGIQGAYLPSNPFGFAGQYADAETGLHYNRYRYFSEALGCYIEQDPIGPLGGLSPYAYVSDPTTLIDPLGLEREGTYGKRAGTRNDFTVRFQAQGPAAQGGKLEESVTLSQAKPVTTRQGLRALDDLRTRLTKRDRENRAIAFAKAQTWIKRVGDNPGGATSMSKSFAQHPNDSYRVDIEVLSGENFIE